jgi:predicted aspartyl protease
MMRMTAILATFGLGLAAPSFAQPIAAVPNAPSSDSAETQASETIQADTIAGSRLTIPVMINGQGPFRFMIDTGSTHTVVSKEVAAKLGLPVRGKRRLVAMGASEQVDIVEIDRLSISPARTLKRVEAPALLAKNLGADGMLGVDSLKGHRIVFDFAAETMLIEPSNSKSVRDERDPTGTIVVNARTKLGQLVLVDADANGEEIWVVVDTGGQNSVGNTPFRRLMSRKSGAREFKRVDLLGVLGDKTSADFTYVGKMRIGGVQLANAAVAFVDAHPFKSFGLSKRPAMLMGIESLRSFRRVSIDFANRKVKFLLPEGMVTGSGQP